MDVRVFEEARATGFRQPPPSTARQVAFDMHTHPGRRPQRALLFQAASLHDVTALVAISRETVAADTIRDGWSGCVSVAPHLSYDHLTDPERFIADNLRRLALAQALGVRIVKFWFSPEFCAQKRLRLDDAMLTPIFEKMEVGSLIALVHIADPDVWFRRVYTDRELYGTKQEQYPQLETVLERHRRLRVIAAHMAGDPEHLDHLQELLDRHPNLYLDTSSTRWMVRELGRRREAARAFFCHNADRILFGTDQVVTADAPLVRYTARYWAHRVLWETDLECPSPVEDPDFDGVPVIQGLNLPADVLVKLYRSNALRLLGIPEEALSQCKLSEALG